MTSRYQCSLPPDVLEKAIKDLNEPRNNDERLQCIDELKAKFNEKYKEYELPEDSDLFLLRFLRSCEFDQEASLKTLKYYYELRKEWREVFDLVENKHKIKEVFSAGLSMFWGGRAKDGSFVLLKRPGLGYDREGGGSILSYIASVFLTVEKVIQNEEAQVYGLTVIIDLSHLGFRMGMQMASIGKKFLRMLQEVLPIRIHGLHVVNEAFVFDALFAIVSKFMSNKIREKIHMHRSNLIGLHETVDADALPPFLRGTGPELDIEDWTKKVFDS